MLSAHFELVGPGVDAGKLPMIVGAGWRLDDEFPDNPPLVQAIDAQTVVSWAETEHNVRRLWPPAAAISSALLASS
jgi:hypothetical protein